jgi:hypothetical protein
MQTGTGAASTDPSRAGEAPESAASLGVSPSSAARASVARTSEEASVALEHAAEQTAIVPPTSKVKSAAACQRERMSA